MRTKVAEEKFPDWLRPAPCFRTRLDIPDLWGMEVIQTGRKTTVEEVAETLSFGLPQTARMLTTLRVKGFLRLAGSRGFATTSKGDAELEHVWQGISREERLPAYVSARA